jgi:hypothetical protein
MRKLSGNVLRTFVATGLAAVATASVARADERIVARVPFDFIVGDSRLPAGAYVVTNVSNDPGVMSIASADGRHFVYTLTIPSSSIQTPAQPELVFEKFENEYVLARVAPADGDEREIVLTRHRARLSARNDHEGTTGHADPSTELRVVLSVSKDEIGPSR